MHIGHSTFRNILFALLLVVGHLVVAQDLDTFRTKPFDRFWTKQRVTPKVGVGMQDRAFFELGFQWHNIYKHPLSLASKGPYVTIDVFVDDSNILLGPKAGYEFTAGVFGAAADVTYFIDHNYDGEGSNRNMFAVTPKAGLSILGFVNVFYGYQIPFLKPSERISTITRNRFSLVFNLNKDYFDLKGAPRR